MTILPEYTYGTRRVVYADPDGYYGRAMFVPVCPNCGRFVKADARKRFQRDTIVDEPDATCSRCGRVAMPFEGFV